MIKKPHALEWCTLGDKLFNLFPSHILILYSFFFFSDATTNSFFEGHRVLFNVWKPEVWLELGVLKCFAKKKNLQNSARMCRDVPEVYSCIFEFSHINIYAYYECDY